MIITDPNPTGLCMCGCGKVTTIATATSRRQGKVKGRHVRYLTGHSPRRSDLERFWAKVQKTESCWLWNGSKTDYGNGTFVLWENGRETHSAARCAYMLLVGPIPDGLFVLHNCPGGDNPACVNPAHLWLGTQKDNMQDMVAKGRGLQGLRGVRGEHNPYSKLTARKVLEIRRRYAEDKPSKVALARENGVSVGAIRAVLAGRNWVHVTEADAASLQGTLDAAWSRLCDAQVLLQDIDNTPNLALLAECEALADAYRDVLKQVREAWSTE